MPSVGTACIEALARGKWDEGTEDARHARAGARLVAGLIADIRRIAALLAG